jgi:phosphoribosylaminoimidazolecarboxamide formyltransferase/IMP cyclohydrolase
VSDKTGLDGLRQGPGGPGGGAFVDGRHRQAALRDTGLTVTDVAEVTGFPEMMDGRVKTLHPKVHGGLLALRDDPNHVAAMEAHGIGAIDLLVVNLYPFEERSPKAPTMTTCIENIDIGGPAMIRAAAKNHAHRGRRRRPEDYGPADRGAGHP